MSDIMKCRNERCEKRLDCYRFTAKPELEQIYFEIDPDPDQNGFCEKFYSNQDSLFTSIASLSARQSLASIDDDLLVNVADAVVEVVEFGSSVLDSDSSSGFDGGGGGFDGGGASGDW